MIEFNKLEDKFIKELNITNIDEAYALEKDRIVVGYGIVSNTGINKIEIFIKEKYRSNGYGKILFKKMLELLKEKKCKKIELTISKNNYQIKSIIKTFDGIQLHTDEKEDVYLLAIK